MCIYTYICNYFFYNLKKFFNYGYLCVCEEGAIYKIFMFDFNFPPIFLSLLFNYCLTK